jgi:hypothetical protein
MEIGKHPHSAGPRPAHGLRDSVQPMGGGSLAQPAQRAPRARPRGHHARRCRGGVVGPDSPADRVSWGSQCEHQGGSGSTPDKVAGAGAHLSGGSTRQWWNTVALVVEGGVGEVQQQEREKSEVRRDPKEEEDGGVVEHTGKAAMAGPVLAAPRRFRRPTVDTREGE